MIRHKRERNRKKAILWGSILSAAVLLLAVPALLLWNGVILFNNPPKDQFPVRGVDVSSYQGTIDWETLASQGLSFAFIKATEGSSHVDPCFARNYAAARQTPLRVGAYHFFSYDSPGDTQADNFIQTVEPFAGMLPPVVDVEFYGDKEKNPPDRAAVQEQLNALLYRLEAHYGRRPILYATEKSYALYLADTYPDYAIWIRDVIAQPRLSDGRDWTFWQYTNRERLDGYTGRETFIDMNVFAGTAEEFQRYAAGE